MAADIDFDELDRAVQSMIGGKKTSATPSQSVQATPQELNSRNSPLNPSSPAQVVSKKPASAVNMPASRGKYMDIMQQSKPSKLGLTNSHVKTEPRLSRPSRAVSLEFVRPPEKPTQPPQIETKAPEVLEDPQDLHDAEVSVLPQNIFPREDTGALVGNPPESIDPVPESKAPETTPPETETPEDKTAYYKEILPETETPEPEFDFDIEPESDSDQESEPVIDSDPESEIPFIEAAPVSEKSQLEDQPLVTPFLKGTKVEKRPLGDVMPDESEENSNQPTPDESIETSPISQPEEVLLTSVSEVEREGVTAGAIYDESYHQPLHHPRKEKSGWLIVLWIAILLLLGALGGAAYFYLQNV